MRGLVIIILNKSECHEIGHDEGASKTFVSLVGECVCFNQDIFMPQVTDYLSDILFGPFISPGVHKDHVFDNVSKFFQGRGLLSSLGIKESEAPGLLEPAAASVS